MNTVFHFLLSSMLSSELASAYSSLQSGIHLCVTNCTFLPCANFIHLSTSIRHVHHGHNSPVTRLWHAPGTCSMSMPFMTRLWCSMDVLPLHEYPWLGSGTFVARHVCLQQATTSPMRLWQGHVIHGQHHSTTSHCCPWRDPSKPCHLSPSHACTITTAYALRTLTTYDTLRFFLVLLYT